MVNSTTGPNSAHLQNISISNPSDLDFDLSKSLKVKSFDAIGLPIYGFLLMFNTNMGANSAPLRKIRL